ncbi:hypothetical protein ACE01N_03145 [Saccharicrinis sp. FJH2]|uniref:hypothetical protein n=1 Tax=Saccharicrinis sp. FJH65 TaxID=3344659 RepID=UPI0035F3BBF0
MYHKVLAVRKVFAEADKVVVSYRKSSHIFCELNCYSCCTKPDIQATVLEFLPLAYDLYKKGEAETFYDELQNNGFNTICKLLVPFAVNGGEIKGCSNYKYRGLICRMFGYSGFSNKNGEIQLSTCKIIKEGQGNKIAAAPVNPPVMSEFYYRLMDIDRSLCVPMLPINKAILKAIEVVLFHYSFKRKRTG